MMLIIWILNTIPTESTFELIPFLIPNPRSFEDNWQKYFPQKERKTNSYNVHNITYCQWVRTYIVRLTSEIKAHRSNNWHVLGVLDLYTLVRPLLDQRNLWTHHNTIKILNNKTAFECTKRFQNHIVKIWNKNQFKYSYMIIKKRFIYSHKSRT